MDSYVKMALKAAKENKFLWPARPKVHVACLTIYFTGEIEN